MEVQLHPFLIWAVYGVKEQRNILREIRKQKANWIGHIMHRNSLLQQVIEGKIKGVIEVKER
jgi:heme exporter protein D